MDIDAALVRCFNCQAQLDLVAGQKILRTEECPRCYADLRCCKMCAFYDPSTYNQCREPLAERLLEKNTANYCDYFILKGGKERANKDDLINVAASLFKD